MFPFKFICCCTVVNKSHFYETRQINYTLIKHARTTESAWFYWYILRYSGLHMHVCKVTSIIRGRLADPRFSFVLRTLHSSYSNVFHKTKSTGECGPIPSCFRFFEYKISTGNGNLWLRLGVKVTRMRTSPDWQRQKLLNWEKILENSSLYHRPHPSDRPQ